MFVERRETPRYDLWARVGVSGGGKTYWGSVNNLSRTGVAITLRQTLKTNQKVTLRFLLHSDEGREVTESLTARVLWTYGDKAAFELDPPLKARSPALLRAPCLVAYLLKKEAGG